MPIIQMMGIPARDLCAVCTAGTIHSRFAKAINIALDNGELISLYRADQAPAPAALITSISPFFSLDNLPVAQGDTVTIGEKKMVLAGQITFSGLDAAVLWHSAFEGMLPKPRTRSHVMTSIHFLNDYVKMKKPIGGLHPFASSFTGLISDARRHFEDPFLDCAYPGIQNLLRSIRTKDQTNITAGSNTLLGLGPGLTPSGDDFLAGLMAALHFTFQAYRKSPEIPRDICQLMIRQMSGKTNRISRHFLHYASTGQFGQTSEQVLFGLLFYDDERLWNEAAQTLLQHGATSGVDQLMGILCGAVTALDMINAEDC